MLGDLKDCRNHHQPTSIEMYEIISHPKLIQQDLRVLGGAGGGAASIVFSRMCEYGVRKQTHFDPH